MVVTDFIARGPCKQALAYGCLPLLLLLAGCQKAAQAPMAMPPPPVTVAHPLQKPDMIDYDEFTARLSATDSVQIHAQVSGYLQKVNFKDGQEVKKNDVLFIIDPRPFQAVVDRVEAELERAQTELVLADSDYKRAKDLSQSKAISVEELDSREQAWAGAQFAVKSAQASLETAKLDLGYTSVLAPIDGRVGRALVTEGNLVNGGGSDPTLLTTLVSVDPIYAYIDVDEATVMKYQELDREGLRKNNHGVIPATLALGNSDDFVHSGYIDFINNTIDSGTGTLQVRAVMPNADRSLIVGEFGRLRVTGSGKYTAYLVPDYALGVDQDKKIVYVVGAGNKIEEKEVVPGPLVEGLRVIRSGLSASDLVVLDRLMIIRPGMPVTPHEEPIKPLDEASPDEAATTVHP